MGQDPQAPVFLCKKLKKKQVMVLICNWRNKFRTGKYDWLSLEAVMKMWKGENLSFLISANQGTG
jgi:hypothetical protein